MPRYAAIGLVALSVGCLGPKSQQCESDGASWVCPETLACAAPPTYCANPLEVGACANQPDGAPCRTDIVPDGLCVDNTCQQCSPDIEGCRAIGWNSMTVPSGTYDVIDAVGSGDAWAGGQTTLVHYDGAHWEPDATFPTLTGGIGVTSIGGTSTGHMFVGTNSPTVYHQVAGAWTATMTSAIPKAVWADADDDAFAVGLSGDVERFSGTAWTALAGTMTTATLGAVWGSSASNVYAVGTAGAVIHYNGTSWTATTVGTGTLAAVWGSGPADVYVGGTGGIWHSSDGSTWTSEDASDSIVALWGDSSSDVFAGTKTAGILRSDGSGLWVPLVSPTMASSISGSGPADAFAATGTQILHYTGSCWSTPLTPLMPADGLRSVSVASPSAVFAVGDNGAIDRFDGTGWTQTTVATSTWDGVWARSANDAYAVNQMIAHWDGATWTTQVASDSLAAVTGTATSEYAVGLFVRANTAGTWSEASSMFDGAQAAIWVADDASIFVAGDQLYGVSSSGDITPQLTTTTMWAGLWGASSSDVFAVGNGGVIRHFDGTSWSDPMDTETSADLHGVWGTGSDDVFAVGDSGTLLHYHAQLWSIVPPPAGVTATFSSVAGSGSTIFVVGPNGTVARLIESAP